MIDVTVMKRTYLWGNDKGFALPTVMIASVVMMIVLLAGLASASSVNSAIKLQYQSKVAQLAVESGVAKTNACLAKSNQIVTWGQSPNYLPLKPNTDCNGVVQAGVSEYILDTPTLKSTFEVPAPADNNGTQRATVVGKILRARPGSGVVATDQTVTKTALVGGQNSFSNVAFGYLNSDGAFFAIVLPTGEVKGLGTNLTGRLGDGTVTNRLIPTNFVLPTSKRGVAAFTNFLSVGANLYVITQDGEVYGAGLNDAGQVGNGFVGGQAGFPTNVVANPVKFNLPAGVKARFVAMLQQSTFVIGDNHSIYSAGICTYGQLGINNGACTNVPTPTRVALPTVNTGDSNTLPVAEAGWVQPTNLVADRLNMYVRMQGGYVYGWGINDYGQLGTGNTTQANAPIRLQAIDSFATPNFTQVAFNGTAVYTLDVDGRVWAAGSANEGEQLGAGTIYQSNANTTLCMRKDTSNANVYVATCASSDGWQMMEFWPDNTWRWRSHSYSYDPTDATLCATATSASSVITMTTCTGASNQQWTYTSARQIQSVAYATCAQYVSGPNQLLLGSCANATSYWTPRSNVYLQPVPRPPYDATLGRHPKYTRITTDNRGTILLDEKGDAWMAGGNNRGQAGTGAARNVFEPVLRKVVIPAGRKIVDVYITEANPHDTTNGTGTGSYSNSYFILDDGSVYGAGANNYGQLGNGVALPGPDAVLTPVKMDLPAGVQAKSVQAGFGTAVVLTTTGKVYTVGNNATGQLGDGTTTNSSTPKANEYTNQRSTIVY